MVKILRIDQSRESFKEEELSEELIRKYIGGRGFGAKILFDELEAGTDPLGPENKLILLNGPLAGTGAQSCARWMAVTKSPLTGTYTRAVGGGNFAAEMKFAGLDGVIIEGKAKSPVYVWVKDNKYEFRDATKFWGMETEEAHKMIRAETNKDARMACIGPAGENLVRFACIVSDRRTASRGGIGAVMGSKHLKALVVRGTGKPIIAKSAEFNDAVREQIKRYRENPFLESLNELGTNAAVDAFYELGHFPSYNFKQEELPNVESFAADNLSKFVVAHYGCYNCMISCGKIFKIVKGPYAGIVWDLPEYETHWCFGSQCGNTNIESIIWLNKLCDQYGLDTISAGNVIGFAMELYEKGIISKCDADGLELRWGNYEAMGELLRRIALRHGFGDVLAQGVKRAAEEIGRGAERFAMHIKGLELPAYEPRVAKAQGLNWVTAPAGANHCMGWSKHEIVGIPEQVDPYIVEGKGKITKYNQDETAFFETGIVCIFPAGFHAIPHEIYGKMLSSATGIEEFKDPAYLWKVGERIWNLERLFNVREGFRREHDSMPERIRKEPIPRKAGKGQTYEHEELLNQYYEVRGWDKETGIPSREKLEELGLGEEASKLGIR